MSPKDSDKPNKPKKIDDWDLESPFDTIVSLEELINMPPFKAASDSTGGTATAGARIPIWLERKVIHLTEIRGSPYHLKSDVFRDAIYIGLRVLNMRYKSDPDWATEAKMARVIDKANLITRIRSQINQIAAPIEQLWSGGDEEQAISTFEEFIASTTEIADEWHRGKQLQLIRNNHLLREVAERCSVEARKAVFGDRSPKDVST